MNKTEELLVLLINIVIDTHNYTDLSKHEKELERLIYDQ